MRTTQKLILILVSILLFASCRQQAIVAAQKGASHPQQESIDPIRKIIGGALVEEHETENKISVMLLDDYEGSVCTGTLVGDGVILTAAHCVLRRENNQYIERKILIQFGVNPLESDENYADKVNVQEIYTHPEYMISHGKKSDLALIFFRGAIPFDARIASIASEKFELNDGFEFTAIGYGRTNGVLSEVDNEIGALRRVQLSGQLDKTEKNIFLADISHGSGVCSGDSGGSAIVYKFSIPTVVGVAVATTIKNSVEENEQEISYCQDKAVYINIKNYAQWIKRTFEHHKATFMNQSEEIDQLN
jgi:secreted trypsin-like serine protease